MGDQHHSESDLLCDQIASLGLERSSAKHTVDHQHPPKLGLNHLCESCVDNIFPKDREWQWLNNSVRDKPEKRLIGPFTMKRLFEAIEAGCHFCTLVSDRIRRTKDLLRREGHGSLLEMQNCYFLLPQFPPFAEYFWFEIDLKLGFNLRYPKFNLGIKATPATVLDDHDTPRYNNWIKGTMVQNVSYTSLSEQTLDQVRQWLRICQQTHTMCNAWSEYKPRSGRPAVRFIDLGVDATHPVRLVDRQMTVNDKPVYITLSYRWTAEIKMSQTT
ncbi:hypothetical protein B0T20DRAFT_92029 [Sordaria brevicollis]|uniref:Uncharacterized protein n=1 Tax=Sordaria brevicollis TaxID=83679 RepID=A0AAE0NWR9_SORBR|nr:hypothetical protein B0T20DRAFT_92029 [Sordaria brevicollis]